MDIHQVFRHLPHRYPFLLIDRVLECKPGESLIALKNVTINEPYFQGHFPQRPVMPGVLILESLAQATGILAFATVSSQPNHQSIYYLVGIDNARFKKPVEPGDQLILKILFKRNRQGIWIFDTEACVDEKTVATATLMCTARD